MEYPSKAVQKAVESFKSLPGIGNKTAVRLVLHLLKQNSDSLKQFELAVEGLRTEVKYCQTCFNLSDHERCAICSSQNRDQGKICVVQDVRDVLAIESTGQFTGAYHVLGGVISPMEGVGPDDLKIAQLVDRVKNGNVSEIIFALSATMEGDTTIFYISKQLKEYQVQITTIAKGIAIGGELEFVDEITLGRSLLSRIPFDV
ncbi:recombination protein RecR [bacterium]|nr:recombination protein RecR [bacterium]